MDRYSPMVRREIGSIVDPLLSGLHAILGEAFVGFYLEGSLALGDFDDASDIDFVAVTRAPVDESLFDRLRTLHDELSRLDSRLALDLEGFYVSPEMLRRIGHAAMKVPNLERGRGERLKWAPLWASWIIHQSIVRDAGIALVGPPPVDLIDPIEPVDLKRATGAILGEWGGVILAEPERAAQPGYQPYIVLTICRLLYTIEWGRVTSKRQAAEWAATAVDERWRSLIRTAWVERRPDPVPVNLAFVEPTLEFVRMALQRSRNDAPDE